MNQIRDISAIDPIGRAWTLMVGSLFQPFAIGKWFSLGFCAFLATLGQGGFNGPNINIPSPNLPGLSPSSSGPALAGIVAIVIVVLVVVIGIWLLILWLSSRGRFMLIDNLVHRRSLIKQPWKEYAEIANSLCLYRIYVLLWIVVAFVVLGGLILLLIWPSIQNQQWEIGATFALIVGIPALLALSIGIGLIFSVMEYVIVPAMYAQRSTFRPAWESAWNKIIRPRWGTLLLFVLMNYLLGMGGAMFVMMVGCVTCCIGFLPYISAVLTLPATVFLHAYALYYVDQFGPPFNIFHREGDPPTCYRCGYDLTGTPLATSCPECGAPLTPIPQQIATSS